MNHDNINHPPHYCAHASGIQAIAVSEKLNFCLGNAFKYLMRCSYKGTALEDLHKSQWYLNRALKGRDPWYDRLLRFIAPYYCADESGDMNIIQILEYETRYSGHMTAALNKIYVAGLMNGGHDFIKAALWSVGRMIAIEEGKQEQV